METDPVVEFRSIASEHHGDAGIAVVVDSVAQHYGLQGLVDALFSTVDAPR